MDQKIELRQLRDFGAIVGDTFVFIKQNFKPLMKCFFYICGLFMIAGVIGLVLQQAQVQMATETYSDGTTDGIYTTYKRTIFSWEYLLLAIIMLLTQASIFATVLSFIALYIKKGNVAPNLEEVWSYYKFFILRVFGSLIGVTIFIAICFLLCVFPGFYVFPAMVLFFPIMVLENASFSYSFDRGFRLLRDEWWNTAVVVFVVFMILYMCRMIFQIPSVMVEVLGTLTHADREVKQIYQIGGAIFSQFAEVFMIIPVVASTLIYFNLVEKKESAGLLERIETFGQQDKAINNLPEEY
jgi:hypothetical protein